MSGFLAKNQVQARNFIDFGMLVAMKKEKCAKIENMEEFRFFGRNLDAQKNDGEKVLITDNNFLLSEYSEHLSEKSQNFY